VLRFNIDKRKELEFKKETEKGIYFPIVIATHTLGTASSILSPLFYSG
jgi:hypothetical protein